MNLPAGEGQEEFEARPWAWAATLLLLGPAPQGSYLEDFYFFFLF